MSTLQSLLDKLSDHEQSKRTASPPQRNSSPNAFTKTEIEMAKTLCTLPSNGREERMDEGTNGREPKEEESKDEAIAEGDNFGNGAGSEAICRPIGRPLSTLSPSGEKIFLNANFESFAEFDCAFEEWKSLYKHPFRVASSEKHHDPRFKYRYVVYHCSRYGEPRKRGQGRRPHQNYLPCGCLAKLRLNFHPQPGEGCLCVTTLHTEHNHEPMSECHSVWLKRRKSSPEEDAAAERSAEGGREFESSTVSGEHSPNSTVSSSTALLSPLSLHAPQPLQLLHNSPSSSGGQSSSESAGSSSSGGETAAMAALLMRTMPSPLSEAIGGRKTPRQTRTERPPSAMFVDSAELGNAPSLSAPFKPSLLAAAASSPAHGSPTPQSHSLLLSTLKAALMANVSNNKDGGAQTGAAGMGNACKRMAGEWFRQQQQRTAAEQRQTDQQQTQQQHQWHILPIIQELLRLEHQQQQNSLINGSSNDTNQPQNVNQNHQTLFTLICQSLQRDQPTPTTGTNNINASPFPSSFPSPTSALGTSATALLSALRPIVSAAFPARSNRTFLPSVQNVPAPPPLPISASLGFFPSNQSPSSSSPSSLLHPPTVSPLIGILQQAHLISTIGQPYGANGAVQRLSPPQAHQRNGNGTTAYMAQQMQMGGGEKQQRREQQQMADTSALNMGRAEIIKEADHLLQTLVNQMIHSKDLVSYLARLRRFLAGSTS